MKTFAVICFLAWVQFTRSQSTTPFSILINEIMADPNPVVELPNAEYLELKNNSKTSIDLFRWKIVVGNNTVIIPQSFPLQPDSFVVICAKSQAPSFKLPHKTIGLSSFPSLPNEEGIISIIAPDGKTIHGIEYKSSMHENALKENGGWALEMAQSDKPCATQNYFSSLSPTGGTPGSSNSVLKRHTVSDSIFIHQCFATDSKHLLLELNQGVDSLLMSNRTLYNMDTSSIQIVHAEPLPPLFSTIQLTTNQPLQAHALYTLRLEKLISCYSKTISPGNRMITGIPKPLEPKDIVLNEILYDPPQDGTDFIELYNTSSAIINLKQVFAANRINTTSFSLPAALIEKNHNFFPGELLVLSADTGYIKRQWPNSMSNRLLPVKQLPSLPNTSGSILLLNHQGIVVEEFQYDDDMHFPLLRNTEGVSLERIHVEESALNKNNWHSAAASSNYATPTRENSQQQKKIESKKRFELSSDWISPDNDGHNDFLNLHYNFDLSGYMLSATLFSIQGNPVAKIFNNELCASSGIFIWNGFDQVGNKVPPGAYILFTEAIHKSNKPIQWKKTLVIK